MTIEEMVRSVQRECGVVVDGRPGPKTWGAIYRRIVKADTSPPSSADISAVDPRSEKAIQTLLPEVRPLARSLVHGAAREGITIRVTSGTRTYAEQDALYEQGRTTPGPVVTNARGGYSNHNFGIAFDVTIFRGATPVWESPAYKAVGALGRQLGLEWGGDWRSFTDEPHFQLRPGWAKTMSERDMLNELRRRKAAGKPAFG